MRHHVSEDVGKRGPSNMFQRFASTAFVVGALLTASIPVMARDHGGSSGGGHSSGYSGRSSGPSRGSQSFSGGSHYSAPRSYSGGNHYSGGHGVVTPRGFEGAHGYSGGHSYGRGYVAPSYGRYYRGGYGYY